MHTLATTGKSQHDHCNGPDNLAALRTNLLLAIRSRYFTEAEKQIARDNAAGCYCYRQLMRWISQLETLAYTREQVVVPMQFADGSTLFLAKSLTF